ncbi:MAG: hypothetical protein R3358_03945 [Woeseiaceae bacterium]|nr:hypothetical protein [Woeseiaceae bacterium]
MKSAEINDWLQVAGLLGVIVSLIFVGIQLKQDRQFALSEGMTDAAESSKYWAELLASNAEVWTKGIAGQELTDVETQIFDALADSFFLRWQAAWVRVIQHGHGASAADRFAREAALHIHLKPGLQAYWARRVAWTDLVSDKSSVALPRQWVSAVNEQLSLIRLQNSISGE